MLLVYLLKLVLMRIGYSRKGKYEDREICVLERSKGCKYANLMCSHSYKKDRQKEEK